MAKKIIFLSIIFAIAGAGVYFFLQRQDGQEPGPEGKKTLEIKAEESKNEDKKMDTADVNDEKESPTENKTDTEPEKIDCKEECENYEDEDIQKRCIQECEMTSSGEKLDDCEKLSGTSKDSCWKNKALKENDFSFCNKISDQASQKSCKSRVTEELIEKNILETEAGQ